MNKKVTIQDIADALGISRNTVSKAINNSEGLADATREKILLKAVEMGYKQFSYVNTLAGISASSSKENPTPPGFRGEIALFTGLFLTHSHFASLMLDKFQREISDLGYTMNTHRITDRNLADMTLPVTFQKEQVKAIICIEMFDWDYAEMLCNLGLPILFVDGPSKKSGRSLPADQLYMDNTTEITRFVNDMLKNNLTRIGFIGNHNHCQSFFERYTAFYLTMLMAGQKVEDQFVINSNTLSGIKSQIASLDELPDVFICANDFLASDTLQALTAVGKRVPDDVKLCGFDDSAESRMSRPPITTIHIHTQIMAFTAVHLLISRIKHPFLDFRTVHTETDLIYRDSTKID